MTLGASRLHGLDSGEVERLAVLARISRAINASYNIDDTLSVAMDVVVEALKAARGCIMLDAGRGSPPRIVAARGIDPHSWDLDAFAYSRTVVAQSWESGESLLATDALRDQRLSKSDSLRRLRTRSLMCVPMRVRGATMGIIYVDNDARANLFAPTDLRLLEVIGDLAAAAIERSRYYVDLSLSNQVADENAMQSLGRHTRAVAHDFNNIASVIRGHCDAALVHLDRDRLEEVRASLAAIETACHHANALSRLLVARAGHPELSPAPVDLQRLVGELVPFLKVVIGLGHDLEVSLWSKPTIVLAGPLEIEQILFNLAVNARHAMPDGGTLTIDTAIDRDDPTHVRLSVADSGTGMKAESLQRLLQGKAQGVGLRVIQEILQRRGAAMRVESREGEGTRFDLLFPLAAEQPVAERKGPSATRRRSVAGL